MFKKAQVLEFFEEDKNCSYFDDRMCDIRYKYMESCSSSEQYEMLQRGWRRFGNMHFVPECKECNECKTIRIDVSKYKFSKSERRIFNKNKNINVYMQKPTVTLEHIDLFNKYHKNMQQKKNWPENKIDVEEYVKSYVNGAHEYGKELLYFIDDKLVAVALIDIVNDALSSIYCYYDHDYEHLSLGKFSILAQLSIAKQSNIKYLYLGYWIKDHFSMGYKENYKPFEILQNRPSMNEETIWRDYE